MIDEAVNVLLILVYFAAFGLLHSWTASAKFKSALAAEAGNLMAFYRLLYNIISLISFYYLYMLLPGSSIVIYDLPAPYDYLILIPQFLALIGFIWCLRYFDGAEFLGIKQIKRYFNGTYSVDELDERLTFRTDGPYRLSRHPLYFFSILFLLFRPFMDLEYLVFLTGVTAYFYIGSYYEERKLTSLFGSAYTEYQSRTPRIFPSVLSR